MQELHSDQQSPQTVAPQTIMNPSEATNNASEQIPPVTDASQVDTSKNTSKSMLLFWLTIACTIPIVAYNLYDMHLITTGQGDEAAFGYVLLLLPVVYIVVPILFITNLVLFIASLRRKLDYIYLLNICVIILTLLFLGLRF